jgi:3-deoxy-D-manno-octulosonate 8-phosphate phosphatase (KDO 8-P phosphatase)
MSTPELDIEARARRIRLLALDVDGVLTDGHIHYTSTGEELKSFSILDGLGIKLLRRAGVQVAVITARRSAMVDRRVAELGIEHCLQGREDKLDALRELIAPLGIALDEVAYMGDDLPDLGAILSVGLGLTVANASSEVAKRAPWRAGARGGDGAVREACEMLLRARGVWDETIARYLPRSGGL